MKITVAKAAGFCFGVRRAYKILEGEIAKSNETQRIVTLGNFVHNPIIVEGLRSRGVPPITEEDLPVLAESASESSPVTVILRTHGVSKALNEYLSERSKDNPFFKIVDCTCPCVSKIHRIVEAESAEDTEDKLIIIIGDPNHPEVKAIKSYSQCECKVYSSLQELQTLKTDKKHIVCVAQTTQKLTECKLCQNYL